jgi:hypothetical protein
MSSCNYGPPAVEQPAIDPSDAAELAIEQYDTSGDGIIAGDELDRAPALRTALARLDSSGDGGVAADEIERRIRQWQEMRTAVSLFAFTVTLDGSPLIGASVTFEPEEFLGGEVKAAGCATNDFGRCGATIPDDQRPDPTTPPGMHFGLYRVKISKVVGGRETIPARYNDKTTLGQEVAADVPEINNNRVVYALTTK